MRLYPAIDLKGGQCVRLKMGDFNKVNVYSEHPFEIARDFESMGAEYLHVVDLDAALSGHGVNEQAIRQIIGVVNIPVQTGGGIRTKADIEKKLDMGLSRVIIGTKALEEPEFVEAAVEEFGADRIVVGIDAKDGMVAVRGWETVSTVSAIELALKMKQIGVTTIIYTDISRDGMLTGPNIEYTEKMVKETGMDIVASGGMSRMEDLLALQKINVEGAIIGKALYENKIDLKEALEKTK